MSTAEHEHIPALTLGWRLKMSLTDSHLTRADMAREQDVTPGTISRWMSDEGTPPKRPNLILWAHLTRVPLSWIEHGAVVEDPDPGEPIDPPTPDAIDQLAQQKRLRKRGTTTGRYLTDHVAA